MCMYVCMSENLYPVRLKQKSRSRAAVSNRNVFSIGLFTCDYEVLGEKVK